MGTYCTRKYDGPVFTMGNLHSTQLTPCMVDEVSSQDYRCHSSVATIHQEARKTMYLSFLKVARAVQTNNLAMLMCINLIKKLMDEIIYTKIQSLLLSCPAHDIRYVYYVGAPLAASGEKNECNHFFFGLPNNVGYQS